MAYKPYPKALYHPNRKDYNDHITVLDEIAHKAKLKEGYGETPDNMGKTDEKPGKPVKPKKSDFKDDPSGFKIAMKSYKDALIAWEESEEE